MRHTLPLLDLVVRERTRQRRQIWLNTLSLATKIGELTLCLRLAMSRMTGSFRRTHDEIYRKYGASCVESFADGGGDEAGD
jgi:hypothetical protein